MKVRGVSSGGGASAVLRRELKLVLKVSLVCAGAFIAQSASATDDIERINVYPDYPEYYVPEISIPPIVGVDTGNGGGSNTSGGGQGTTGSDDRPSCSVLAMTKPASCPQPIAFPKGFDFAESQMPYGIANRPPTLRMAIAFTKGPIVVDGYSVESNKIAREYLRQALITLTTQFANPGVSYKDAVQVFRGRLARTCAHQTTASDAYRIAGQITRPEKYCFSMMRALDAEADDSKNFWGYFNDVESATGLDVTDLFPSYLSTLANVMISSASRENSLGVRYRIAQSQAQCSIWWNNVQAQQCKF